VQEIHRVVISPSVRLRLTPPSSEGGLIGSCLSLSDIHRRTAFLASPCQVRTGDPLCGFRQHRAGILWIRPGWSHLSLGGATAEGRWFFCRGKKIGGVVHSPSPTQNPVSATLNHPVFKSGAFSQSDASATRSFPAPKRRNRSHSYRLRFRHISDKETYSVESNNPLPIAYGQRIRHINTVSSWAARSPCRPCTCAGLRGCGWSRRH